MSSNIKKLNKYIFYLINSLFIAKNIKILKNILKSNKNYLFLFIYLAF
jgi:hypothetical protein